jgi:hypothetical protein
VQSDTELSVDGFNFATIKEIKTSLQCKVLNVRTKEGLYMQMHKVFQNLLSTGVSISKKIFISYSHKDEDVKKELDTHFAALKRSGKIETWHDRKIVAGDDWDKTILDALLNSDIALLLLSPDFMESDYIWNTEILKAIENGVRIIPIFVRPCDFKESVFEIYKIQGLPADCKWIVSSQYQYRDEAYLEVINGIKKLLD